ncbi:isoleucine--tRNA ligase [Candidatus Woesearchaeota archaeon]|jgi:isoleucyl-tRNA synthetase|nr:isoleucine--tRNA ligase [Candidatus Woesearchaeota archaeon]MBT4336406.1 isoleucine--tRNA ligase [Candidatus Woesearchaeota archaeon]MBT4469939.1 isoleucine--tRNA ligase [Candidatus Woesearchaeota archaeon]MBT6744337.1 isoleucine--tRNA ligase [Candidatus Woesearchaeota archaeon]
MKYPNYNHKELEPEMLEFWKNQKILQKLKDKNENGKKFTFLQGPPYTSGRIHLGHAWNYALKDMALRYKRSQGFNVWDRNGYDVHGLPTAHKVMAENDLKAKEDIESFGVGKFIKLCEEYAKARAATMDDDFRRIGCTIKFDDPYMALTNNYMEGEWWMVKQAWKKDRLYLGDKSMTWCGNCETALAKHECEYQELTEDSVFLKFPIKGKENEFLVIWTTTPWTIPFNLAIMVNPNLDYVKAKLDFEDHEELWVIGKSLVGPLVQSVVGKALTVVEEFKGETLLGTEYVHPWEKDIPQFKEMKEKHPKLHTVILSEQHVDFTAGSGLVHCAPGCGPEDQVVGKEYGLPAFNNLTEKGEFPKEIGERFAGRIAKVDDKKFIEDMEKDGFLIATTKVEHDYPTCWRCHKPVIFKTTKQWFFKIEDLRVEMIQENAKVHWVPKTQGFDAWTSNLKDNSITRQRYWGTPVPLWECDQEDCKEIEVIGSVKELEVKVGKENIPEDLHRPWIDEVKWKCKCGKGTMKRIPDILDVWIDAGTASWNCLYYPQSEEHFVDNFPADLILEATEQVRLWFSMLSICSQLAMDKNCYKNVYMHGMIRDVEGTKMSKSIGNIISPNEMITKHGADVLRYYMCQTNAGQDIKFSWDEAALKGRHLLILWNTHKFLINLCKENKINPVKIDKSIVENVLGIEEKYIFSKLNSTLKKVTELFEQYRLDETIAPLEELFLELSRTYIQMVRDKCALGEEQEKEVAVYTIFNVLMEFIKSFNIISPFITEAIYQNFKEEFNLKESSIMHYNFPTVNEEKIDLELEQSVEASKQIVQSALNAREKAKLGLRWPVKEIVVVSKKQEVIAAVEKMRDIIQKQVNTKSINVLESLPGVSIKIKCDPGKIGKAYGQLTPEIATKLTIDSPETIIGHLEKESVYTFSIGDKEVKITKDMIIVEREVPDIFQESEFRSGQVYLNTERSEELDAEGYAREVMRNIQQLRKKAGLEKLDSIVLLLKVSKEMKEMLEPFKPEIEEKIGADKMEISIADSVRKHEHQAEFKVKWEKFSVWFSKV